MMKKSIYMSKAERDDDLARRIWTDPGAECALREAETPPEDMRYLEGDPEYPEYLLEGVGL